MFEHGKVPSGPSVASANSRGASLARMIDNLTFRHGSAPLCGMVRRPCREYETGDSVDMLGGCWFVLHPSDARQWLLPLLG